MANNVKKNSNFKKTNNTKKSSNVNIKEIKRKNNYILLVIVFSIATIILLAISMIKYDKNKDIVNKINVLDNLEENISEMNSYYDEIVILDKKIKDVKKKNSDLTKKIDVVTKNIKDLNDRINKYNKK